MNTVIRHIQYLLARKDLVIVPGFGAFLAHRKSACIDMDNGTIQPPCRVFAFNRSLSSSDGLLVFSVARALNISIDRASDIIAAEVELMNKQLMTLGFLDLPRIGVLKYDRDLDSIEFVPCDSDTLSIATSALSQISWRPSREFTRYQEPESHVVAPYSAWRRFARIAASVAILIGIWFLASTPLAVDDAAFASLAPTVGPSTEAIVDELPQEIFAIASGQDLFIDVPLEDTPSINDLDKQYLVIVGSFASISDAEIFMSRYPDQELFVFQKGNYIRVAACAFTDEHSAYRAVATSFKHFPNAWVCHK